MRVKQSDSGHRDEMIWMARTHDRLPLFLIAKEYGLSLSRVSQIIHTVDVRMFERLRIDRMCRDQDIEIWPIESLGLSTRATNCLLDSNIRTIGRLREISARDLLSVKNLGRQTFHEIAAALADLQVNK